MGFHILSNPALKSQVAIIQDKDTDNERYRATLSRIGSFMAYEISHLLDVENTVVETNFAKIKGMRLKDENVIFIAVLRAAIPMVNGALKIFPRAQVGIVSARRVLLKEGNAKKGAEFRVPVEYSNVPEITKDSILIVPDPALASGSSVVTVLKNVMKKVKPKKIIILSVACAKEGVANILQSFPQAEIFTAHLGQGLNSKGYIVPDGPGDAGDRSFGLGSTGHSIK
ncbi:uracil phosphoribosyltransferase [Candidatus Gottesmanbacteria bacterium]|nr:uracil phosphoribosyltransferase [Candidatus Gottesmanbacteria bacterium]